jgi:hypothetical protein
MDEKSIVERVVAGELKLEPLRKVLCSCQQLDPRTGKAKEPCVCKRAKAGRLR